MLQKFIVKGDTVDEIKCECFVKPIILDLETRLTAQQIIDMKNSPLRSTEEFITSYKNSNE